MVRDEAFDFTQRCVDDFAKNGFRTLFFAQKYINEETYEAWNKRFKLASISIRDREQVMSEIFAEIETDLELIGSSAIED